MARPTEDVGAYDERAKALGRQKGVRARECFQARGRATDAEGEYALQTFFWRREGGVTLELGGLDGVKHSETLIFERIAKFRRVVVEASPTARVRRRDIAPTVAGVQAAVCADRRSVHWLEAAKFPAVRAIAEFAPEPFLERFHPRAFEAYRNASSDWQSVDWPALRAAMRVDDAAYAAEGPRVQARFTGRTVIDVACTSLSDILDALELDRVDFAIIDVEGAEIEVLKSVDWNRLKFSVVCVETDSTEKTRPPEYRQQVVEYMAHAAPAYSLHGHCGRNTWFVHRDFAASRKPEDP